MQKIIILTSFTLLLGACSWSQVPDMSWLRLPDVYTVPRYQGNIVEQKMIDQLAPGMTRDQVLFIMGTPLIEDPFHPDRWDYVYTTQTVANDRTEERIALFFQGDVLTGLQGNFKPEPQPEGVVLDDLNNTDEDKQLKSANAPTPPVSLPPAIGEDTTLYTGGKVNAVAPESPVTETQTTPASSTDPYKGLTPDGRLATPTPPGASADDTAAKALKTKAPTATPSPSPLPLFLGN